MTNEEARKRAIETFGDAHSVEEASNPSDLVEVGRREGEGKGFLEVLRSMTPEGFSIPELLYFGLTALLGFAQYGPGEKMRWGVAFRFKGVFFAFEYRKFGLRFFCERRTLDSPLIREILGRSRGLTDVVEQFLSEGYVDQQIAAANITVQNLYDRLDFRYRFLREQAEAAYARPAPPPEHGSNELGAWTHYDVGRPQREGAALATAAVDAYFSREDHLFVLAQAFLRDAEAPIDLLGFFGMNWPAKARTVLDLTDPLAKTFYDRLLEVREQWRNPLAHGGFLSGGGSVYFHLPGVGALPTRLRRTPDGVRAGFRLPDESFSAITQLFDQFDDYLKGGPLRYPLQWADAGLDVAFDRANRSKYRAAMSSESAFQGLVDWTAMDADRHANMDY